MVIYGVSFDMVGKQPIVLLKTVESNKFLPIWIGHPEAAAILMKLQGASTPRPMTHDLLCDMLGELDVKCSQVAVTELRDNTFFASITLVVAGREVEIDSRPSDALAIAVRSGAPIFAAEDVMAEPASEVEREVEATEAGVDRLQEVHARHVAAAEHFMDLHRQLLRPRGDGRRQLGRAGEARPPDDIARLEVVALPVVLGNRLDDGQRAAVQHRDREVPRARPDHPL